jgi:hypothetical protein
MNHEKVSVWANRLGLALVVLMLMLSLLLAPMLASAAVADDVDLKAVAFYVEDQTESGWPTFFANGETIVPTGTTNIIQWYMAILDEGAVGVNE